MGRRPVVIRRSSSGANSSKSAISRATQTRHAVTRRRGVEPSASSEAAESALPRGLSDARRADAPATSVSSAYEALAPIRSVVASASASHCAASGDTGVMPTPPATSKTTSPAALWLPGPPKGPATKTRGRAALRAPPPSPSPATTSIMGRSAGDVMRGDVIGALDDSCRWTNSSSLRVHRRSALMTWHHAARGAPSRESAPVSATVNGWNSQREIAGTCSHTASPGAGTQPDLDCSRRATALLPRGRMDTTRTSSGLW